jgi:ribosomal protein L35
MKKSMSSRIKITKNGKVLRRKMGTGHFRTRKSTSVLRGKRSRTSLGISKHAVLSY